MMEALNGLQVAFWFCAILGTGMFAINTIISMVSGVDTDLDPASHSTTHDGLSGPDSAFQLLSLTSLTGFVMMFGWVGLAAYEQFKLPSVPTLLLALMAGTATMYATALLFSSAKKLVSSGSVFDIRQAVGKTATVYARIPDNGKGQIQIVIADATREIAALSSDNTAIESNTTVQVVRSVDDSTVVVAPINP